jgi:hypothetical protein
MTAKQYFAIGEDIRRGDPSFVMSQSALKTFASDPWSWVNGREVEETASMRYGSAVDVLYLTPSEFSDYYSLTPRTYPAPTKKDETATKPWTMQANYCKQWVADQKAAGKEVISTRDLMAAKAAVSVLEKHEVAAYLRSGCSSQTVCQWDWEDPVTGIVVPLKCMIDLEPPDADYLADFKTTNDASLAGFRKTAAWLRYDLQGAFYLWGYRLCVRDVSQFAFIVSESKKPFPAAAYHLTPRDLAIGAHGGRTRWGEVKGFFQILSLYCKCLDSGIWPQLNNGELKSLDLYRE